MSTVESRSRGSLLLGVGLVLLGGCFLLLTPRIAAGVVGDNHDPGPRAFPVLIAVVLVVLGAAEIGRAWWAGRLRGRGLGAVREWLGATTSPGGRDVVWFLLGLVLYLVVMSGLGFVVATLVFGVAFMRFLRAGWVGSVVATAVLTGAAYGVFVKLFRLPLPEGGWGLF